MPTYEYICQKCGETLETLQSIAAPKFKTHKEIDDKEERKNICNGKVDRLIGAGCGIIFNGTGFYQTDYKHKADFEKESKKILLKEGQRKK